MRPRGLLTLSLDPLPLQAVLQGCFAAAQDNVLETSPWSFLPALEAAPVLQARGSEAGGSGSAGGIAYSPPPVLVWHGAEDADVPVGNCWR